MNDIDGPSACLEVRRMRTTLAHFLQRARQGVRTASGQVLTPPFRPIRDCVSVRRKRVLPLCIFYDAPEEPDQLVNSCYGLEPETIA